VVNLTTSSTVIVAAQEALSADRQRPSAQVNRWIEVKLERPGDDILRVLDGRRNG